MGNEAYISNKADRIEYHYALPDIMNFPEVILKVGKSYLLNKNSDKIIFNNPNESSELYYKVLGEDIIVWYYDLDIHKTKVIHFDPIGKDVDLRYVFRYITHQNDQNITLEIGGEENVLNPGNLFLSTSKVKKVLTLPEGFKGGILNMVVTDKFLTEYIPYDYLDHPVINAMLQNGGEESYSIKTIPQYLKHMLMQLLACLRNDAEQGPGASRSPIKIKLLHGVTEFIDTFFRIYLGEMPKGNRLSDEEFKAFVIKCFRDNIFDKFMGIDALAFKLHISKSNFKRRFSEVFDTTPFQYFREMQMKEARRFILGGNRVEEVAFMFSFESSSNFIRAFKKAFHQTPGSIKS